MQQPAGHSLSRIALAAVAAISILSLTCTRAIAQQCPCSSSAPKALTSQAGSATRELDAFARALAGVTKYSATVSIFDQKDTQTQNVVFDYTFVNPSNVTVHVIWVRTPASPSTGTAVPRSFPQGFGPDRHVLQNAFAARSADYDSAGRFDRPAELRRDTVARAAGSGPPFTRSCRRKSTASRPTR